MNLASFYNASGHPQDLGLTHPYIQVEYLPITTPLLQAFSQGNIKISNSYQNRRAFSSTLGASGKGTFVGIGEC
jgi:hypothetical protein